MAQPGSFFEGVDFWITDTVAGAPAAPANGQGFSMRSDEMRALLAKCRAQRDSITAYFMDADRLSRVVPPGNEPASATAVNGPNGINETGRYYQGHLRYQYDYYTELIHRMEKALGMTTATDQEAAGAAKKAGGLFQ